MYISFLLYRIVKPSCFLFSFLLVTKKNKILFFNISAFASIITDSKTNAENLKNKTFYIYYNKILYNIFYYLYFNILMMFFMYICIYIEMYV